jgi:hypothetical protein
MDAMLCPSDPVGDFAETDGGETGVVPETQMLLALFVYGLEATDHSL